MRNQRHPAGLLSHACDTVLQTGKLDPHHPKVCGHRGNVLDIKWNPFNDFEIASCSEDATVSECQDSASVGWGWGMLAGSEQLEGSQAICVQGPSLSH